MKEKVNIIPRGGGRNFGIDLLRIVAMFYVVICHVTGYGGVLGAVDSPLKSAVTWALRIWAMCAVNCYAIISGYVGYSDEARPYRYSRYVTMWLQALFYGVLGAGVFLVTAPDMLYVKHLVLAFAPVTSGQWWYFTAYTALFFMIPWINKLLRNCTEREVTFIALGSLLLFSVYASAASVFKEPFQLEEGYSMAWLTILYIVGAWMKKCRISEKGKMTEWIATGLGSYIVACTAKLVIMLGLGDEEFKVIEAYISPLIVAMAIAHVAVFSRVKLPQFLRKFAACFAPAAFGVFLLHMQWDMLDGLITGKFVSVAELPVWLVPLAVIGIALVILVIGLITDKFRIWLFGKLHVNRFADWFVSKVKSLLERISLPLVR